MIHADDETLQAYLDDALDEQATAEIERQLAASADLRQREQEMRDLLADCGYLFATLSKEKARSLVRAPSSHRSRLQAGAPARWGKIAAGVVLMVISGIAVQRVLRGGGDDLADVQRLVVTLPGATRIASATDDIAGARVRRDRFALASGATLDVQLVQAEGSHVLRGAPDLAGQPVATPDLTVTGDTTMLVIAHPDGYVLRITSTLPPHELRALAARIVINDD